MVHQADIIIIGGGAIGLACCRTLSRLGKEVILLEKNAALGAETSSRSSEVIHAGIYYSPNSLKKILCVKGKSLMHNFLQEMQIPFNKCGKLIVATDFEHVKKLKAIQLMAERNGVKLRMIDAKDVNSMEKNVECVNALWSESSGIFDSHYFLDCLRNDAESHGATIVTQCCVEKARRIRSLNREIFKVYTSQGVIESTCLINAAGLSSPFVAQRISDYPAERAPRAFYAKGNYFRLCHVKSPFTMLIYPLPVEAGLGVHATIDMNNSVKFGPDVEWMRENDPTLDAVKSSEFHDSEFEFFQGPPTGNAYMVNDLRKSDFIREIAQYWPAVREDFLEPDYSGIRPKLVGPSGGGVDRWGRNLNDFIIEGPKNHGVPGLINLFGIESPGLTSSLAIAEYVKDIILDSS